MGCTCSGIRAIYGAASETDRSVIRGIPIISVSDVFVGLFPLPGANRTQVPPILAHPGLPMPMPVQAFGMGMGNNPNLARQSRRLYIGSITPEVNEHNLAEFFNSKMKELGIGTATGKELPVVQVQMNYEKNYAFVEVCNVSIEYVLSYIPRPLVPYRRGCNSSHRI